MSRRDRVLRKADKAPDERGLCGGPWEVEPVAAPDLPLSLHVARHFAGTLDSLALLHRSLAWQALALLGREMMRRLT